MDSKTPVTLLQELLLKKGCSPDYVLVHNGVGTHNPLFVFEVSGLGRTAMGRGKSKREAKHAAAQELLHIINALERNDGEPLEDVVQSPYADMLKDNAVGALQDFCCIHKISPPTYEQTRDEGLPHAKLFGMRCRVSKLSTVAEARTKKQAKQSASHLMLLKLKECLNDDTLAEYAEVTRDDLNRANEERVIAILDEKRTQNIPLGTPLDQYDMILKCDIYPRSEVLEEIKGKENSYVTGLADPVAKFVELIQQLELSWEKIEVRTKSTNKIFAIEIDSLNKATFFGQGTDEDEAIRDAAIKALRWFSVMAS